MKFPEASENLYPKSEENLRCIVERYFRTASNSDKEETVLRWKEDNLLTLNQLEFGAKFVVENESLLDEASFSKLPYTRTRFALKAIFFDRNVWNTSGANTARLERFRE